MNDVETRIVAFLEADATNAPSVHRPWEGPTLARNAPELRRGPTWVWVGLAAAAAAAVVGIAAVRTSPPPARSAPSDGVEWGLVDQGLPASYDGHLPTVAGLSRRVSVQGLPDMTIHPAVLSGSSVPAKCVTVGHVSACAQRDGGPTFTQFSAPEVGLGQPVFVWHEVPVGTDVVQYVSSTHTYWQRPVLGTAIFPSDPTDVLDATLNVTAFAADGSVIEQAHQTDNEPDERPAHSQPRPLEGLGSNSDMVRSCLTDAGATWDHTGNLATLHADVNQDATWSNCIAQLND